MRAESLTDFHVSSPMCYPSHSKPLSQRSHPPSQAARMNWLSGVCDDNRSRQAWTAAYALLASTM